MNTICASNQQLFSSQCEMNIRSCELKTHLYAIAPHYCNKDQDKLGIKSIFHGNLIDNLFIYLSIEYTRECGYDEPLLDIIQNRFTECDTLGHCPMNSYCNTNTNRCCVKGR